MEEELKKSLCGSWINKGCYRDVYEHRTDPTLVVKIEEPGDFSNVEEYKIWENSIGTPLEKCC